MKRLQDKVALVSGAASGIGRATSLRLAAEGAAVLCVDINPEPLRETVAMITAAGDSACALPCDVADENAVRACLEFCRTRYGKLDVLCNIAAIFRAANTHEMSLREWQRVIDVNLTSVFLMCRAALPLLLQSRGNIVNTSSSAGLASVAYGAAYSASKGAILSFSRALAVEYAKRGVRVNCVCPAGIASGMTDNISFPEDCDVGLLARQMPLTGMAQPDVVANVIAMLASGDGAHVTGADIKIDGGALA
jgi:NAD(P)-dependent dehydrogenase (short-subunit alcohol dehydrogenase family)